jgi:hypothetical protein
MGITDKVRKTLWGRSGNKCAICKVELIITATTKDEESVIGEECHITSPMPNGPRYNSKTLPEQVDDYDNLILLCRLHHKMIDDQLNSYTANDLKLIKDNHETWVVQTLSENKHAKPIKIFRKKENIPPYLLLASSGTELTNLVVNCHVLYFNNDEPKNEQEVQLLSEFFQTVKDYQDINAELEPSDHVKISYGITKSIEELGIAGFYVFCGKEIQLISGGTELPSNWPVAYIQVIRKENPNITFRNSPEK